MNWLQPFSRIAWRYGINACERKAQQLALECCSRGPVANIGGIESERWPNALVADARRDAELDFNTKSLPFESQSIDLAVCEQVIEHLHNTTWFLRELHRILMPGGVLILSTENLASIPNLFALLCRRAPFSTQHLCGRFVGGWKDGPAESDPVPPECHPTYSGREGHVRVMTSRQLSILLEEVGFTIRSRHGFAGGHYVLFEAQRPVS